MSYMSYNLGCAILHNHERIWVRDYRLAESFTNRILQSPLSTFLTPTYSILARHNLIISGKKNPIDLKALLDKKIVTIRDECLSLLTFPNSNKRKRGRKNNKKESYSERETFRLLTSLMLASSQLIEIISDDKHFPLNSISAKRIVRIYNRCNVNDIRFLIRNNYSLYVLDRDQYPNITNKTRKLFFEEIVEPCINDTAYRKDSDYKYIKQNNGKRITFKQFNDFLNLTSPNEIGSLVGKVKYSFQQAARKLNIPYHQLANLRSYMVKCGFDTSKYSPVVSHKSAYAKNGTKWTREEEDKLAYLYLIERLPVYKIAERIERSPSSIYKRLSMLKINKQNANYKNITSLERGKDGK